MNFRNENYNGAFYYYLLMEIDKTNKSNFFTFVRLDKLRALLPNATLLVSRSFGEMSNKRQF
jgi:hypothetical protein